jgi:hypothetical protein
MLSATSSPAKLASSIKSDRQSPAPSGQAQRPAETSLTGTTMIEYDVGYDSFLGVRLVERECHGCSQTNGWHKNHCKAPSSPDVNSSGGCSNDYVTHLPSNYFVGA